MKALGPNARYRSIVRAACAGCLLLAACTRTDLGVASSPAAPPQEAGRAGGAPEAGRAGSPPQGAAPDAGSTPGGGWRAPCTDWSSAGIYALASSRMLYRFDPESGEFHAIGRMDCASADPESMAVDSAGNAFVLLRRSEREPAGLLYAVSTADASCERIERYVPNQQGFVLFSMAFAASADGTREQLYVASPEPSDGRLRIATLGTERFELTVVGSSEERVRNVELAAGDGGRLFALYFDRSPYPGANFGEVDRSTARVTPERTPPIVGSRVSPALAFWDGAFYLFAGDVDTHVSRFRPQDASFEGAGVLPNERIVGVGVTACTR